MTMHPNAYDAGMRPDPPITRSGHTCFSWNDDHDDSTDGQGDAAQAIDVLLHVFTDHWTPGFCPGVSCAEAEAIARFVGLFKGPEAAEMFLWAHSWNDDEETDQHHEMPYPRETPGWGTK